MSTTPEYLSVRNLQTDDLVSLNQEHFQPHKSELHDLDRVVHRHRGDMLMSLLHRVVEIDDVTWTVDVQWNPRFGYQGGCDLWDPLFEMIYTAGLVALVALVGWITYSAWTTAWGPWALWIPLAIVAVRVGFALPHWKVFAASPDRFLMFEKTTGPWLGKPEIVRHIIREADKDQQTNGWANRLWPSHPSKEICQ